MGGMTYRHSFFALAVGAAALVSGCRGAAIEAQANHDVEAIRSDTRGFLLEESCTDGAPLHDRCGLITQRVAMQDFRDSFAAKKCGTDTTEVCQAKFDSAVDAWLLQRYMLADLAAVEATCGRTPERCTDGRNYELVLLRSHNQAAVDLDARREHAVMERRDFQLAVDDAQTTNAVLGVALVGAMLTYHPHGYHHHRW